MLSPRRAVRLRPFSSVAVVLIIASLGLDLIALAGAGYGAIGAGALLMLLAVGAMIVSITRREYAKR